MPPVDFPVKRSGGTAGVREVIRVLGGFVLLCKALGFEPMLLAVCLVMVL